MRLNRNALCTKKIMIAHKATHPRSLPRTSPTLRRKEGRSNELDASSAKSTHYKTRSTLNSISSTRYKTRSTLNSISSTRYKTRSTLRSISSTCYKTRSTFISIRSTHSKARGIVNSTSSTHHRVTSTSYFIMSSVFLLAGFENGKFATKEK
jgi:hypothetical protein